MACCNFYFKRPCKILPPRWTRRGLESKQGDPSEAPAEVQARDDGELNYVLALGGRRRRPREDVESRGDQNGSKTFTVLRFLTALGSHILGDLPVGGRMSGLDKWQRTLVLSPNPLPRSSTEQSS